MKFSKKLKNPHMIALIATTLFMLPVFYYTYQKNKVENVQQMLKDNGYKDIVVGSYTIQRNFSAIDSGGENFCRKYRPKS